MRPQKAELKGVTCLAGILMGDKGNAGKLYASMCTAMGDQMHNPGGHAGHTTDQIQNRPPPSHRDAIARQLKVCARLQAAQHIFARVLLTVFIAWLLVWLGL